MLARQTGKTFTATLEIVRDCIDAEDAERSGRRKIGVARWVILSRGERQAREAMEEGVKRHLQTLQRAHEYAESNDLGATEAKVLEVRLPGGSRVTALPANPDTARGFSANVLLDEFAFHADSRKIWAALFPVISAGKKLRVVSTPNGKANKFYELMTDPEELAEGGAEKRNPWSRHVVDIHQAVAEGLPRDVGLLRLGLGDPDAWAQEHERAGDPQGFTGGPAFIGNDIAARRDLWVGWVWERVGDVLWTREVRVLRRASFAAQAAALDELVARYRPLRIAMDQTGMGEAPTEAAKRRHGARRVEGVLFTADTKQHLATLLKQHAEERRLRIPLDAAVRTDLHSLRRVTTPAGNVRFDVHGGQGGGHREKSHADLAWAAALGLYAADVPVEVFDYRPVPKRYNPDFDRDPHWVRVTGGFVRGVL